MYYVLYITHFRQSFFQSQTRMQGSDIRCAKVHSCYSYHVNAHALESSRTRLHRSSGCARLYRDNQVEIYILPLMTECNMLRSNGRKFLSVFIVTESHRTVRGCHTRAQCRLCSALSHRSHDQTELHVRLDRFVFSTLPSRGLIASPRARKSTPRRFAQRATVVVYSSTYIGIDGRVIG